MTDALAGIVVVAVEQAVAAPFATSRLADAGARVIKVERPEGDFARSYDDTVLGQSAYFVWLNRGKESICLDLTSAEDRDLLARLVAKADVFIQNLKPGSAAKYGFDSAVLRARHPTLITCDISGFGDTGPLAHLKAYDLIVQAESGLCAITGNASGPARVGVSVCDIAAGMAAHSAILQALLHRERTGEGTTIHVSLFDAVADWMNVPVLQQVYGNLRTVRAGLNHPSLAPYGAYPCRDGQQVVFSVQNDREWVAFCKEFLRRPELTRAEAFAYNMARLANRAALDAIIRARFAELDAADAMRALAAAGIAYGRLNEIDAVANHPQVRKLLVQTPSGPVDLIAPPAVIEGCPPVSRAVASLGEHTQAIKAEILGTSAEPSTES